MEGEYLFLYQRPSEIVHATDVITGVLRVEESEFSLCQVRGPTDRIGAIARLSTACLIQIHKRMLDTYFMKDEKIRTLFREWFLPFGHYYMWAMEEGDQELKRKLDIMRDNRES